MSTKASPKQIASKHRSMNIAELEKKLAAKLAAITGKKIIIKNTVSKEILGGIQIRYSGKQIDGSIKTRLDGFEKSLKKIVI